MSNNKTEEPDMNMKRRRTDDSYTYAGTQSISIDSFSNDISIRFTSYLSSRDLVSLALTCRWFGGSNKNVKSLPFSLSA